MNLSRTISTNGLNEPLNQEIKMIQDKLATVEKHFQLLGSTFAVTAKLAARSRDQTDNVAKAVHAYSEAEFCNETLTNSLTNLANIFVQIGTYGDEEAHLMESVVVEELLSYDGTCKPVRDELKQLIAHKDKQHMRRKHLDRLKERGYRNRQEISSAEVELVKATGQVQRTTVAIEDLMDSFERQKIIDIRSILQTFLKIQLRYHSKALELLTRGYQTVSAIDEDLDFQEFSSALRGDGNLSARHSTVKRFPIPKTISLTNSIVSLLTGTSIDTSRVSPRLPESQAESPMPLKESTMSERSVSSIISLKADEEDEEENDGESKASSPEDENAMTPVPAPRRSLATKSGNSTPLSSPVSSPTRLASSPDSDRSDPPPLFHYLNPPNSSR